METQNKPTWEVQQSQEGIIAEAEYEKKEVKHYPRPEYCKCNVGHTLVEVFNKRRNCYDWDCPICITKMQKQTMTDGKTSIKTWNCGHTEDEHCFADCMFCKGKTSQVEEIAEALEIGKCPICGIVTHNPKEHCLEED